MPLLPLNFQREIVARSKDYLVRSSRFAPLMFVNSQLYRVMETIIRERIRRVPGVRAVYLCHGLATGECYPGLSDFDITVVFDDADPPSFYDRLRQQWGSMKRYIPINDMSLLTQQEFDAWQHIGGGWDPRDEVRHWRLLVGSELRRGDWDLTSETAEVDRVQYALGHFQNLMQVAIKEEPRSPLMAIVARRQLYKCFWNSILSLYPKYLEIPRHRDRVAAWIRDHGEPEPVRKLNALYKNRFRSGPVTTLRFTASELAYEILSDVIGRMPIVRRPIAAPAFVGDSRTPISNEPEVRERAETMCASILEMLDEKIESIVLSSTGTVRGWSFYVILRDGLSPEDIFRAFADLRAIHRVFDDPWFNEHFPAGVPIVCSRSMFVARLQTGRSSLHYFDAFRLVLHGSDVYAEVLAASSAAIASPEADRARSDDWERERLIYSLYLHQIYLAWLKPALHDYVTFYFPRMALQRDAGAAPATAEDAVSHYAARHASEHATMPLEFLETYRGKDLDALLRTMNREDFAAVWPLLREGIYEAAAPR